MKKYLLIVIPALLLGLGGCQKMEHGDHDTDTEYTCSMHPQIRQKHPGSCPICGMKLVPVPKVPAVTSKEQEGAAAPENEAAVQLMPAQNSVASVQVQAVAKQVLARSIQLFGEIKYVNDNHLDLTSFYPGRVEKVLIPYNSNEVAAGTPLLELYSEEAIADQEKYLQALRERYLTTFYERKVITDQIETIRARLLKAGLTEEDLQNLVKHGQVKQTITLRAVHGGSIVGTIPHTGERMSQEAVMFHITPLEKVWFAARVFEQDLAALKLGQTIGVTTKVRPEKEYPGRLVFIDRVVDAQTRTVLARFEVDNPNHELLPDMSAAGKLLVKTATPVLAVPVSALLDTGKRQIVYVQKSAGNYQQTPVVIGVRGEAEGEQTGAYAEVREGLAEGQEVVVSGAFLIDAEAQLRGAGDGQQQH